MTITNSSQLYSAVEAALTQANDSVGLAFLRNMNGLGVTLELHPSETKFDAGAGKLYMSNTQIEQYGVENQFASVVAGLFNHEYQHYLTQKKADNYFTQALAQDNRDYSKLMYYSNEANAIVNQLMEGTDYGLNWGDVNIMELRNARDQLVALFESHEVTWHGLLTALHGKVTEALKSAGSGEAQAEVYADEVESTLGKLKPSKPGDVPGEVTIEAVIIGDENPLYFSEIPEFETLEIYRTTDGGLLLEFKDEGGNSVYAAAYGGVKPGEYEPYTNDFVSPKFPIDQLQGTVVTNLPSNSIDMCATYLVQAMAANLSFTGNCSSTSELPAARHRDGTFDLAVGIV